jgi:hypothetical protein
VEFLELYKFFILNIVQASFDQFIDKNEFLYKFILVLSENVKEFYSSSNIVFPMRFDFLSRRDVFSIF